MAKTIAAAFLAATAICTASAQQTSGRDAFLVRQACEQVQRLAAQFDVLETNQNALSERLRAIERGGGEINDFKASIAALKAENAALRREMENMKREIVAEIVAKIKQATPAQPRNTPQPRSGERYDEYTVQKGDTLSLIAQAFGTTVDALMEINALKNHDLQIGKRLLVPSQQKGKRK